MGANRIPPAIRQLQGEFGVFFAARIDKQFKQLYTD